MAVPAICIAPDKIACFCEYQTIQQKMAAHVKTALPVSLDHYAINSCDISKLLIGDIKHHNRPNTYPAGLLLCMLPWTVSRPVLITIDLLTGPSILFHIQRFSLRYAG